MSELETTRISPWPHRWAMVLACATFPLIWVGGFVTTTDAGMAFRDWLTSDGHWMPIYPWFSSAGDKFVEHGHRLLGMVAGILSIVLVCVTWKTESRSWVRKFSLVILAGVILQGLIGGLRIVLDQRTLALLHGCTGPLFFTLCIAMVVFTSRWWHQMAVAEPTDRSRKLLRLATLCSVAAYLQLVVGAVVRHSPYLTSESAAAFFQTAVYFHLLLAALIVVQVARLAWHCFREGIQAVYGTVLALLIAVQLALGIGTWLVKYGMPRWASNLFGEWPLLTREADLLQNMIITSHVAVGSLILVTSVALCLRVVRQIGYQCSSVVSGSSPKMMEVAL